MSRSDESVSAAEDMIVVVSHLFSKDDCEESFVFEEKKDLKKGDTNVDLRDGGILWGCSMKRR